MYDAALKATDELSVYSDLIPLFPPGFDTSFHPEHSGKLGVLVQLLRHLSALPGREKVVVVSNSTKVCEHEKGVWWWLHASIAVCKCGLH